jgi:simple sugar transport system permease protein
MMRMCNPFDILGTELTVIAAVVLGGVSITGGRGSIWGTMIGVFLVTVINKSLIIIGVSSYWQQFVIGLMILTGTGIVSFKEKHSIRMVQS